MSWLEALQQLVEARTGVRLRSAPEVAALRRHVEQQAAALGLGGPSAYAAVVQRSGEVGDEAFARLVDVVTTPYSYFFREPGHFEAIAAIARAHRGGRLRVWSAGCAHGEEPVSVAMLCARLGVEVEVLGTDLNRGALAVARAGHYRRWSTRRLPAEYRCCFEPSGEGVRVRDELRRLVRFRAHNMLDAAPRPSSGGAWDLILCRNVFIYHSRAQVERIAARLHDALRPTGWLVVGASETLRGRDVPFKAARVEGALVWQRADASPPQAAAAEPGFSAACRPQTSPGRADITTATALRRITPEQRRAALAEVAEADAAARRAAPEGAGGARDAIDLGALLRCGNEALRAHRFDEAMAAYAEAQRRHELCADVHFLLGVACRKRGALGEAVAAFRRCLCLAPGYWPAALLLASVHTRLGCDEAASRALAQAATALASARALDAHPEARSFHPGREEASALCLRWRTDMRDPSSWSDA